MTVLKVCVIGLGYVGLPTALKLAESGHDVVGVDINMEKLSLLTSGEFSSKEQGITELYRRVHENHQICFNPYPVQADAFIIAVPTPIDSFRNADLRSVISAARSIRQYIRQDTLVVLESTVPPGTTEQIATLIGEPHALYAHVPERVLPGNLLNELVHNDRIIGGLTEKAANQAAKLYASFVDGHIECTTAAVAEMAKLMENTYRDVNIALANELARICHQLGISAEQVIQMANQHPRVHILKPGPGVGGHCIAVDPWFIASRTPRDANLIRLAREINDEQPAYIVRFLRDLADGQLEGKTIALLGLAYKGNVSDARESPAITLAALLKNQGARVKVHDPFVIKSPEFPTDSLIGVLGDADAILVATDHELYSEIDDGVLSFMKKGAVVLDTRGILNRSVWEKAGHTVYSLGDGTLFLDSHSNANMTIA